MSEQKKPKTPLKFYRNLRSIGYGGTYSLPIPKEIYDTLGLEPKEMLEIYMEEGRIIIQKIPKKEDKKENE